MKISGITEKWRSSGDDVYRSDGYVGIQTDTPGGLLGLLNSNTYLDVDGNGNLILADTITGSKTLAELVSSDGNFEDGLEVGGNIVPDIDNIYSLGTTDLRWKDAYLGPTSLHIISTADDVGVDRDWSWSVDNSGSLVLKNNSEGFINIDADSSHVYIIGNISSRALNGASSSEQFGEESIASGIGSVALGFSAQSTGDHAIALGYNAQSLFANSLAIGEDATTTAVNQGQVGTSSKPISPTIHGDVTLPLTRAQFWYNTADQTTNYQRIRVGWTSNIAKVEVQRGGSGTQRILDLMNAFGTGLRLNEAVLGLVGALSNVHTIATTGSAQIKISGIGANLTIPCVTLSSSNSLGGITTITQTIASVSANIGQGGTAGYTALLINPLELSIGSGTRRLLDAQVDSDSKFIIDIEGNTSSSNVLPFIDNTYTLGTPDLRWKDAYFGPGSLHIISNSDDDVGEDRDWKFEIDSSGDLSLKQNGDGYFRICADGSVIVNSIGIGVDSVTPGARFEVAGSDGAFLVSRLNSSQRDVLSPSNGMMLYNTTNNVFQGYSGSSWKDLFPTGQNFANVKSFGATGDGVTDDAVAIHTAHESLLENGTLYFPPGDYYMNTLNGARVGGYDKLLGLDQDGVTVILDREANIRIDRPDDVVNIYVAFLIIGNNITIQGQGSIIGPKRTGELNFGILMTSDAYGLTVDGISITDFDYDNILITGTDTRDILIRDANLLRANRNNLSIVNGKNILVSNCLIKDALNSVAGLGIDIEIEEDQASSNIIIENCRILNNYGAVKIGGTVDDPDDTDSIKTTFFVSTSEVDLDTNDFDGVIGPASFLTAKPVTITTGSTPFESYNTDDPITIYGIVDYDTNASDTIYLNDAYGGETVSTNKLFLEVNAINIPAQLDTDGYMEIGTPFGYTIQDITINNNLITNSGGRGGINCSTRIEGLKILNNTVRHGTLSGIAVGAGDWKNLVVSGNHSYGNGTSGIVVGRNDGDLAAYASITNNICHDNKLHGISISEPLMFTCSNNVCYNNVEDGISVAANTSSDSGQTVVTNNICYNNKNAGIYIQRTRGTHLAFNHCFNNFQEGILDNTSTELIVENNRCESNSQEADDTYSNIKFDSSHNTECRGNVCRAGSGTKQPQYGIDFNVGGPSNNRMINNHTTNGGRTGNTLVGGSVTEHNEKNT